MKTRYRGRGFRNVNVNCPSCPNHKTETIEHIFIRCAAATPILDFIYPTLQTLLRYRPFKVFKLILNEFPQGIPEKVPRMAVTLLQIAMYVIWTNRVRKKYHNEVIHVERSKHIIAKRFRAVLELKFRKHFPHALAKFRENYCHTPQVCTVVNNDTLEVNIL